MCIKKLSLICLLVTFIHPGSSLAKTDAVGSETSPDCSTLVYIDPIFSDFFKHFVWHQHKKLPAELGDQLLYWILFQEELELIYGYLENPPSEVILRNQMCYHLEKRGLRAVALDDAELFKWFSEQGKKINDQIKTQSITIRNNLIKKQKASIMQREEQDALMGHLKQLRVKVRKDYF